MTGDASDFEIAVASPAANLLVVAPPGCGKTELLARRADMLIATLGPYQKILALTFSNKARANLEERLVTVLGTERKRRYITVRNFHGHAAEIVRSHGRTLGIEPSFAMPDKQTQTIAVDPHVTGLAEGPAMDMRRAIDASLRSVKQSPYDDAQVLGALKTIGVPAALEIELARQELGDPFYDDLLRHAQRLIRVPEVAELYRAHYGAILVDEFQDLSPQQLDLALRSTTACRTVVGDPLQGIYSWAGARPVEVEKILRRLCGPPSGLGVSYRSSPRVLDVLNLVAVSLGGQALACHDAEDWHEEGIAAGAVFDTGEAEAQFIERTSALILEKQPAATIGVITRAGYRRKLIDEKFEGSELPSTRWELPIDDPRMIELLQVAASRLGSEPTLDALKVAVDAAMDAADIDTRADATETFEELERLSNDLGSMGAALAHLRVLQDATVAISPGVHLLNAHTGKGQQFDWVFIPGIEDGHIPSFLARTPAAIEEEHRVLLVMLSRARHGVVVSRSKTLISKKGRPWEPPVSRWASEISAGLVATAAELHSHIERMSNDRC